MPRCESYNIKLIITPLNKTKKSHKLNEDCLNS